MFAFTLCESIEWLVLFLLMASKRRSSSGAYSIRKHFLSTPSMLAATIHGQLVWQLARNLPTELAGHDLVASLSK